MLLTFFLRGSNTKPIALAKDEEQVLLHSIKGLPFREFEFQGFTAKRRVVSFGWRYDFNGGGLIKTEDLPDFLQDIRTSAERFADIPPGSLQQVLITEYSPGAAIGWHKDRSVFGDVVGISLLSPCVFRLRRKKGHPLGAPQSHCRTSIDIPSSRAGANRVGAQHPCGRKTPLFHNLSQCYR